MHGGVSPPPPAPPPITGNVSAQHGESCGLQLLRNREPGGHWSRWVGAREQHALRGAAPASSTEAGGKLHVRHSSAQAVACSL
jgi:hypothetical protein